ncbi:MAG: endolytic transglycosylase MltG [Saprospiraceae bacterium]|nr:endolytic transglycosylase MltG [Saprospiraceae bacterium]
MSKNIKRILIALGFIILAGAGIAFYFYRIVFSPNVIIQSDQVIYIPTGSKLNDVVHVLDTAAILKNTNSFEKVAGWMKFEDPNINPGKYTIKPGWNNRQLVSLLRAGIQTPVNLVINNVRTVTELAGKIASQIEIDSIQLAAYMTDSNTATKYNLKKESFLSLFVPNTYQVYWTVKADAIVERLAKEQEKFWASDQRLEKAKALNMTKEQVYTMASIVERETQAGSERPTVAGLYLNRLEQDIPLQADPTVVFATGIFDLRRVLNKHLEIESPYNTYKYAGLPPGPIFMPSIQSIDAVLNAEDHDYIYMCARPDNSGLHAFAASITDHNRNANRYRNWLNERGIK